MNTALSAILLTLAEPLEVAVALALAPVAMVAGQRTINKDFGKYPHLELYESRQRVEFCREVYGPSSQETIQALADVLRVCLNNKKFWEREDCDRFLKIGLITQTQYEGLTSRS